MLLLVREGTLPFAREAVQLTTLINKRSQREANHSLRASNKV